MKILYVGDSNSHARARQRFNALVDMGYEAVNLSYIPHKHDSRIFPIPWKKPDVPTIYLYDRIKTKFGYWPDLVDINSSFFDACKTIKPELIWIDRASTIKPHTYKLVKELLPESKLVFYSEDDIYVRRNRSKYLTDSLNIFDVVYTTKPRNVNELPNLGAKKIFLIYKAFDVNFHRPIDITDQDRKEWGSSVSFVGSFEKDRAEKMFYLAENGIRVRVWGWYWNRFWKKHPNLILENRPVYNDDYIKVINSSDINLNFLRKAHRDKHTARSVEIPACEAFMLTERTDEHLELFEEGKEADFFDSPSELLSKVRYYLKNPDKRNAIAEAGRKRCLTSLYSHHGRLKTMLNYLSN